MTFSEIDFLILDFVKSNSPASLDKILEKFPESDFNTHFRLKQLQSEKYIDFLLTSTGYKIDCFVIRPQGISALQDFLFEQNKGKRLFKKEILKLSLATALGYLAKSLIDFIFG